MIVSEIIKESSKSIIKDRQDCLCMTNIKYYNFTSFYNLNTTPDTDSYCPNLILYSFY